MGGNALKQYETRRIGREEYEKLENTVRSNIDQLFGPDSFNHINFYRMKNDFGDMDFVLVTDVVTWKDDIIQHWGLDPSRYFSNGNVLSFGIDNFQVDAIHQDEHIAKFAINYYSYNDLGNLLGRYAHKLGMKLGHDGLWLVVRSPETDTRILDNILLTRDWNTVLDILYLDKDVYSNGFDTLDDIFEYVMSSKWFDPDIFLLDNRNHTSRVRDKKRITYNKFLDYIVDKKGSYQFKTPSSRGGHAVREPYYTEIILDWFPWVKNVVNELLDNDQLNQKFKEIYNGKVVEKITGLSGKKLGIFMGQLQWDNILKKRAIQDPDLVKQVIKAKMDQLNLKS